MGFHVVIAGSTGMVGRGVLLECLASDQIAMVTVINRSSLNMQHPKLQELILADFMEAGSLGPELGKPDACFHCMGVSAIGLGEAEYTRLTFDITKVLADLMYTLNPGMVFTYVSGAGTDSTEKGRIIWARVKGRTENYLLQKGFGRAVMFRPGVIIPEKGIRSRTGWYQFFYTLFTPLFPLLKRSASITTTTRLGQAMINTLVRYPGKAWLENRDINRMAAS